jgi:Uncharacterised nucleotidyltransferase
LQDLKLLRALASLCGNAIATTSVTRPALPPLVSLFAAAEQHDVAGLLAATLLANCRRELPDEVCEGLTIYREGMRLEALRAEAQLAELLHLLAQRGLPAMPFKGPLLARSAYADPTLRPCLDLDLMVHPDDVPPVLACLLEAGFQHQDGLGPDGVVALRQYAGEYILFRPKSLPVEPHWHPAPWTMAFSIDIDALWLRARPTTFLGVPCYLPSQEDHLFLLALHGAKEQWHKLKWVVDVAALLASHPRLDLTALHAMAAAQGCGRMLDLALLLTHRLFAIPEAIPATGTVVARLADRVLERLDRTAEAPPGPYVVSSFHWRLRERRRDRLNYAIRTLFTPRVAHYRRLPLPPALRWLHVPLKLPWDHVLTPAIGLARRMSRSAP